MIETVTWGDLVSGDRVLLGGPNGTAVVAEVARQGRRYCTRILTHGRPVSEWSAPQTVDPDLPAGRLYRGETSVAIEVLRAAGLNPEIIE